MPALAAALAGACSAAPGPVVAPIDIGPPPAAATPLLAARWIDAGGATLVGPKVAAGTLVLLGGRRALVDASGVKVEEASGPEPLWDVVDVPVGDRHELVGAGARAVYRLQEPLGALTPIGRAAVTKIGAGNGGVYVWTRSSDLPTFVDVSGHAAKGVGLDEPLRAVAFRDARAGAAIFSVSGLAATFDGGATWRLVTGERDEPVRANGLRRGNGGAIRAFVFSDGPDAEIDLERATLRPLARAVAEPKEPSVLAWIRATARDPLEVAASSGLDAPGGALVASHGLLAKVDLKTGALAEMTEFARGKWVNPCTAARAGDTAYVACSLSEGATDMFDPFGVLRLHLDQGPLKLDKPVVVRNGEAELRSSPSGGAMLIGACVPDDDAIACVKQADGKWIGIKGGVDMIEHGAGPLADGRVAFVRGEIAGEPDPELPDDDLGRGHHLRVAAIDREGKEKTLALIGWEGAPADLRVSSPIEEDDAHALHFVLNDGDTPYVGDRGAGTRDLAAAADPLGDLREDPRRARRRARARHADVARRRGDLGAGRGPAADRRRDHPLRRPGRGGHAGERGRLPDRQRAPHRLGPRGRRDRSTSARRAAARRDRALEARGRADPPLRVAGPGAVDAAAARRTGAQGLASRRRPSRRRAHGATSARGRRAVGACSDTVAVLEVESLEKPDAAHPDAAAGRPAPISWSFRWLQPTSIGDRVHAVTMPRPSVGETTVTGLRSANASGNRALFTVRLVNERATRSARGGPPTSTSSCAPRRAGATPRGPRARPGALARRRRATSCSAKARAEPIVWLHDTSLVVWFAGEAPRVAAQLSLHGTRQFLGEPTAGRRPAPRRRRRHGHSSETFR